MTTTLLESDTEAIRQWCVNMRQAGVDRARKLSAPLVRLNYSLMDKATVELVDATLYFTMFGVDGPEAEAEAPAARR